MKRAHIQQPKGTTATPQRRWWLLIALPVWVYVAFWLAQLALLVLLSGVRAVLPLEQVSPVLLSTVLSAVIYALTLVIAIWVPYVYRKRRTTRQQLAVNDRPALLDILVSPLVFVAYALLSGIVVALCLGLFRFDTPQQELPFTQEMLGASWHYVLAFLTLAVVAPVAEELLFRGYLYGKLRAQAPLWLAAVATSIAFGAAHLWAPGSALQWLVAIDTFVLSLVLCAAREYTGAIWTPIAVHMIKNSLAFYLLFINPQTIDQLRQAALLL